VPQKSKSKLKLGVLFDYTYPRNIYHFEATGEVLGAGEVLAT